MSSIRPLFLDDSCGKIFAVYHAPISKAGRGRGLIYVPPFAEEMNRARRMAALEAGALAEHGIGVLLLDLFGTGESQGDFQDARWDIWLDNIFTAAAWMASEGHSPIGLWGLRLGALLAVAASTKEPQRFGRLLLWQPVVDGRSMLTQFLRIQVAGSMGSATVQTTDSLRSELAGGLVIEIAGYALAPELARAIDNVRLANFTPSHAIRIDWLEVGAASGPQLSFAGEQVAAGWRKAGISIATHAVSGEPFWALQETTLAPELLTATTEAMRRCAV